MLYVELFVHSFITAHSKAQNNQPIWKNSPKEAVAATSGEYSFHTLCCPLQRWKYIAFFNVSFLSSAQTDLITLSIANSAEQSATDSNPLPDQTAPNFLFGAAKSFAPAFRTKMPGDSNHNMRRGWAPPATALRSRSFSYRISPLGPSKTADFARNQPFS